MNIKDIELHGGIHTMYILSSEQPQIDTKTIKGITMYKTIVDDKSGEMYFGMKVNPNKYLYGNENYIDNYREFTATTQEMLKQLGIDNYKIQRVDFRIDNYSVDFETMYKINNIVIELLAMVLDIENKYESAKNDVPHNIVARSRWLEIECYDRIFKDGGGIAKTRIELRRSFPNVGAIDIKELITICNDWIRLINTPLLDVYYNRIQEKHNTRLCREWEIETNKCIARTSTGFLAKNRNNIYTSQQMKDLCYRLGLADNVCYTYKKRIKNEYYTFDNVKEYLNKIVKALQVFFYP